MQLSSITCETTQTTKKSIKSHSNLRELTTYPRNHNNMINKKITKKTHKSHADQNTLHA